MYTICAIIFWIPDKFITYNISADLSKIHRLFIKSWLIVNNCQSHSIIELKVFIFNVCILHYFDRLQSQKQCFVPSQLNWMNAYFNITLDYIYIYMYWYIFIFYQHSIRSIVFMSFLKKDTRLIQIWITKVIKCCKNVNKRYKKKTANL